MIMTDDCKTMAEEAEDSVHMLGAVLICSATMIVIVLAFVTHYLVTGRWV